MAGFWPLYSNFVSKSQVTLALPGKPSNISKSVGGKSPALLLVPNVDFLIAFIQGNIGIADSISKAALLKNINGPIAANDEMVARHFSKVNKLGFEENIDKYKDAKGKIKIPKSEIALSPENDSLGFKAMEKAILQSIFETQKPYMEIAKMVIDVMVAVEDIVARIMPLISASPLTATSDKPVGNGGSGKRPAAIGYQGGKVIKKAVADLDRISKIGGKLQVNKDGTTKRDAGAAGVNLTDSPSDLSLLQNEKLKEMGKSYKIIDVVYSTGNYDPKVDYLYTYLDLPADDGLDGKQPADEEDPEDPYDKYKPKRIILGIFNSKGVPMDPNSKLYTINQYFNPNDPQRDQGRTITSYSKADWITRSPKWVFPKSTSPNAYVWPTFGTPTYRWKGTGVLTGQNRESVSKPGAVEAAGSVIGDWEIKKYKKGEKNELNGFDAIEGDPIIVGFAASDVNAYTSYFTEYTTINMRLAKDLTQAEKEESTKTIMGQLNVKSHLENVNLYAQSKSPVYKDFSVPDTMKLSFKPMQITVEEAKNDPNLAGLNGKIWIDPESDYETKIIAIKPATKNISYSGSGDESDLQVDIKSYVKNKFTLKFRNAKKFNIDIRKNSEPTQSFKDVDQYVLENWNYSPDTRRISENEYTITLWSESPSGAIGDLMAASPNIVMGTGTGYTQHGYYQISITLSNGAYLYEESSYETDSATGELKIVPRVFSDGIKKLGDGSIVKVVNKRIERWYFLYEKRFGYFNLPLFGNESTMELDVYRGTVEYKQEVIGERYNAPGFNISNSVIPLYQIKVANNSNPAGKVIDPSMITNDQLTKDTLYSDGRYGAGSKDLPQELGVVYRYAKTDLDDEIYYVIEGIRPDDNTQGDGGDRAGANAGGNAGAGSGGGKYRLPHAIGAITVFIKMLVKIFSKLIPSIMKLLKLFGNPMGFVTDIIMEKLGESFSVFSPEAKKKFDGASKLVKNKKKYNKPRPVAVPGQPTPSMPNMGDYVRQMKSHFENSPLKNHVAVDSLGSFKDASGKIPKTPSKEAVGNFKFVYDGVGFIPFKIFGKDLSFGMELKMANIITKEWGNPSPMKLIFNKEKNSKDPNNINVKGPNTDDGNNSNSKDAAKGQAETDPNANRNARQGAFGSDDPNKRYVTLSTWYSTGQFINGVDYRYVYIDQQDEDLLKEVDNLSSSLDPEDLRNAKDKLEEALAKDPEDEALKNKLDEIKKKIFDLNSNTQPLLKMILGIVTLPIKIIAGVIEWIMNFFKSLTNPMALPGKIIQFLSFKWIMDFFSPLGILKMAGINFDPSVVPGWLQKATEVNKLKNMSPEEMQKMAAGKAKDAKGQVAGTAADKIPGKAGQAAGKADATKGAATGAAAQAKNVSPADAKAAAQEKIPPLPKGVPLHKGSYALPDDFELADLSKFLNVAFLAQLPTYSTKDMREQGKNIPKRLFTPIICFIEKLINGIIDFVWSTFGIEAIIPPPHIKLCNSDDPESMDPNELGKILNGETPGGAGATASDINFKTEIVATDPEPSIQDPPLERYVYEVTLPDGKVIRAEDREELDKFIQENRDLGFDFQF